MTGRLQSLLDVLDGHKVFIQTHNFPDPDALASAFAVKGLLGVFDIEAKICYSGKISNISCAKMIELLGIEIFDVDILADMVENDYILTVDSQIANGNVHKTPCKVVACIDHHPSTGIYNHLFRDVRVCGSCSSIVADYYFSNKIKMDKNTATALMYGLKMDTEDLSRGVTDLDVEMYRRLFYEFDEETYKKLSIQQMPFSDLMPYTLALSNIKVYDGIGFSFIDTEVSDGLIASVCDFMLRLVEVQFSVVYGVRKNGLKFSARSSIDYLDAGNIISSALEGLGTGGGHAAMAGGYLPFESLENAEFDLEEELQNRFINAIYFSRALKTALTDPLEELHAKQALEKQAEHIVNK